MFNHPPRTLREALETAFLPSMTPAPARPVPCTTMRDARAAQDASAPVPPSVPPPAPRPSPDATRRTRPARTP